ncbi:MAG: ComF family protein [Anaerolineae bacterium]
MAAGTYDGVLRTAIRALKYRGLGQVSVPLGRLAAQRFSPDRAAIVVPVPAHPRRTRRRGLDHADLLAEVVAQATGLALAPDGLVRVRATAPQFALDPAERRRNVAGAFAAGRPVRDRTVLLVDDVHTTGATANECAIALLRGGAIAVDVCTVARAILPSTGLDAAGAVAVRR